MLYMRGMDMIMMDIGCEWNSHEEGGQVDFEAAEEAMVAVEVAVVVVVVAAAQAVEGALLHAGHNTESLLQVSYAYFTFFNTFLSFNTALNSPEWHPVKYHIMLTLICHIPHTFDFILQNRVIV